MSTITYENDKSFSFEKVQNIIEKEYNLTTEFITNDNDDYIEYSFLDTTFVTKYNITIKIHKDLNKRIKLTFDTSSSMRGWIWFTIPLFVFTFILWIIHIISSSALEIGQKYASKNRLDEHFL